MIFLEHFRFNSKIEWEVKGFISLSLLFLHMHGLPFTRLVHFSQLMNIYLYLYHNHPQSTLRITLDVHSVGLDKCAMTYNHHYSIIYNVLLLWKSPVLHLLIRPPHPSILATTGLFIVSTVVPFPGCHIVGLIQYGAFSDWRLCLVICI